MDDYDPNSIFVEDALKVIKNISKKITSYEVIDPVSSDIDISFYLHHKQYGTEWIKRDDVSSAAS